MMTLPSTRRSRNQTPIVNLGPMSQKQKAASEKFFAVLSKIWIFRLSCGERQEGKGGNRGQAVIPADAHLSSFPRKRESTFFYPLSSPFGAAYRRLAARFNASSSRSTSSSPMSEGQP